MYTHPEAQKLLVLAVLCDLPDEHHSVVSEMRT